MKPFWQGLPPKIWGRRAPHPLDVGDDLSACVILPNLVIVGQTVRA